MPQERPDPAAWARVSDEEIARREEEERVRQDEVALEELALRSGSIAENEEPPDPEVVQIRILSELQRIRFRLGVLVVFLVVIPVVVGFIIGFAIGFE